MLGNRSCHQRSFGRLVSWIDRSSASSDPRLQGQARPYVSSKYGGDGHVRPPRASSSLRVLAGPCRRVFPVRHAQLGQASLLRAGLRATGQSSDAQVSQTRVWRRQRIWIDPRGIHLLGVLVPSRQPASLATEISKCRCGLTWIKPRDPDGSCSSRDLDWVRNGKSVLVIFRFE